MISSTARDLPDHREKVMHACMRLSMFYPEMMEHLTAPDATAMEVSLKIVHQADIYVGIFAFRYGYVPDGQTISIAEMEYNCAAERGIPRLIFLSSDSHPVKFSEVEIGEGAEKLKKLKERLQKEQVVAFFESPDDLLAKVIQALVNYREPDLTIFHYISEISEPPEAYIAHPYTLSQTHRLVGRQPELNLLTDWVTSKQKPIYEARILSIVAMGGLGKSALTWKWFNDIAPQETRPLAGRMWWSFYESDATFENFVSRALAYTTRRPLDEVQKIPAPERESQLLAALDREPFLIVLDGLERILIAYARMDAVHLADDDLNRQTANIVANAYGLPASAAQSFTGEHRLRKTADPRAGAFLRKLSRVRTAKILVSTRLYPADLQNNLNNEPLSGCASTFLRGLTDDDALELWRAIGVTGARDSLLPLFNRVENHPLVIQSLASEVARYRPAPGDFDRWRRDHIDFDPFQLPLVQVKSHVLEFALRGLDDKSRQVLHTIAAFRMPARYDTLAALLVGEQKKLCTSERELDQVLTELEDRGLVGWNMRANRYDLHPIVRGVLWSGLGDDTRRDVYTRLYAHFEALPKIDDYLEVSSLEDLTPAIELYNTLIGLGRYDDAGRLFSQQLDKATLYRLSASHQRVELLEMLFPDGLDQLPRRSSPERQAATLSALAQGYQFSGRLGRAASLYRRANTIYSEIKDDNTLSIGLHNLSDALRLSGALFESEAAARHALAISREQVNPFHEAVSLDYLGLTLATRGVAKDSESILQRSLRMFVSQSQNQYEGVVSSHLAQRVMWLHEFAVALTFANHAWERAHVWNYEADFIRAARVQGEAALGLNDFVGADERLHHVLTRARAVNYVEEELPALIALAELRRRQGDLQSARELLDDVWDMAERGPYPLFHADAYNVLAQIERDTGNHMAAVETATRAYNLAWCDGPPFAYHWGLLAARKHLRELGALEPLLPPFDEMNYELLLPISIYHPDEQTEYMEPDSAQEPLIIVGGNNDVLAHPMDNVKAFFEAAGYTVLVKNKGDLHVTPTRPFDQENYGSSLVRFLGILPTIEEVQDFCKEALLVPGSPTSGYKPAFLICPHLEPVHQLQTAVYQDKRLAVVPITYDWVLDANAREEQRRSLLSVLDAFVGREDPFRYSNPVSVPGDFYGRNDVIAALVRDLDRGQSVGLFGMRKIGKTSVIQHSLRTRTGPTIYIDCQGLTHPATVLRLLPQELRRSLKKLLPKTELPEFDKKNFDDLEILADAVNRDLRDLYSQYVSQSTSASKITLILDEVDRIVPDESCPARDLEEYESLFGTIRSLGQGVERILVCMVAGFSADITQKDIDLSRGVAGNPVYAFFNIHRLGPMGADEIALMINGLGSRARIQFSEVGSLRLYEWSGGHPFLARLLGSFIHRNIDEFDLKRTAIEGGEAYEVDEEAVDRAAIDLLDDSRSRPFVAQILERFKEPLHKAIFKELADAGMQGRTREYLMDLTRKVNSKYSVADTLNSMEVASLIHKESGRFFLFSNLLNELVRRGYV